MFIWTTLGSALQKGCHGVGQDNWKSSLAFLGFQLFGLATYPESHSLGKAPSTTLGYDTQLWQWQATSVLQFSPHFLRWSSLLREQCGWFWLPTSPKHCSQYTFSGHMTFLWLFEISLFAFSSPLKSSQPLKSCFDTVARRLVAV